MQALQRTIQQIAQQMKGLPANSKLLLGSLMIILVMSLFLVAQYAGAPSMVPLGVSNLSAEDRGKVESYLRDSNIDFEDDNGRLMVPAGKRYQILGQLNESEVISGESIDYQTLVTNENVFRTSRQSKLMERAAKMNILESMIRGYGNVKSARVLLAQPESLPGIGKANVPSTASVSVTMSSGKMNQRLADSIGRLVAGSLAGLNPMNVVVTDVLEGRAFSPRDSDTMTSGNYLELKDSTEKHFKRKFEDTLSWIPGVLVSVNAVMDARAITQSRSAVDDIKNATIEERSSDLTSTNRNSGAEPAVRSNTSAVISGSGGADSELTESTTASRSKPFVGTTESVMHDPKGYPLVVNATIGVPRSFFVMTYRQDQNDPEAEPDATALQSIVQQWTDTIKDSVLPLIDTAGFEGTSTGVVQVSMISEFGAGGGGGGFGFGTTPVSGDGIGDMFGDGLVKNVGLGALALLSVVMMFLMVRKANIREELPTAEELVGIPPAIELKETDLVGEADQADEALEGMELNDETLRMQQLLNQINDMVVNEPEDASALFQRWTSDVD